MSVLAKLTGRVLTVVVRDKAQLKLVRCLELPSADLEDIAAVLVPTFVYIEDNLGGRAEKLLLCGFGAQTDEAERRFAEELGVEVEPLRSPLGTPGENNAGLLGYLRSIARRTIEMKIPINLASQPFRRDRAMLVASGGGLRAAGGFAGRADHAGHGG